MFPRYLQYLLTDFRQAFVTGASRDRDELIRFWGQKVKVQGHTIAAEAHSTRRYRRVQLFLVEILNIFILIFSSLLNYEVMFFATSVCLSVCLSARLLKTLWTDFDEIFEGWDGVQRVTFLAIPFTIRIQCSWITIPHFVTAIVKASKLVTAARKVVFHCGLCVCVCLCANCLRKLWRDFDEIMLTC